MQIKGHSEHLVVPVALAQKGELLEATGSFAIKRTAFGIGSGEWADTSLVGDEVKVRFKLAFKGLLPL